MIILILALIFGLAVFVFTLNKFNKAKQTGESNKIVTVLRLVLLFEAILYIVIFAFVFLKTLFM